MVGFQIFAAVNPVTDVYAGFSVIRDLKTNEWRKATAADIKRWNETLLLVIAREKRSASPNLVIKPQSERVLSDL